MTASTINRLTNNKQASERKASLTDNNNPATSPLSTGNDSKDEDDHPRFALTNPALHPLYMIEMKDPCYDAGSSLANADSKFDLSPEGDQITKCLFLNDLANNIIDRFCINADFEFTRWVPHRTKDGKSYVAVASTNAGTYQLSITQMIVESLDVVRRSHSTLENAALPLYQQVPNIKKVEYSLLLPNLEAWTANDICDAIIHFNNHIWLHTSSPTPCSGKVIIRDPRIYEDMSEPERLEFSCKNEIDLFGPQIQATLKRRNKRNKTYNESMAREPNAQPSEFTPQLPDYLNLLENRSKLNRSQLTLHNILFTKYLKQGFIQGKKAKEIPHTIYQSANPSLLRYFGNTPLMVSKNSSIGFDQKNIEFSTFDAQLIDTLAAFHTTQIVDHMPTNNFTGKFTCNTIDVPFYDVYLINLGNIATIRLETYLAAFVKFYTGLKISERDFATLKIEVRNIPLTEEKYTDSKRRRFEAVIYLNPTMQKAPPISIPTMTEHDKQNKPKKYHHDPSTQTIRCFPYDYNTNEYHSLAEGYNAIFKEIILQAQVSSDGMCELISKITNEITINSLPAGSSHSHSQLFTPTDSKSDIAGQNDQSPTITASKSTLSLGAS